MENFQNLGLLRSHLLAYQALHSKHWSWGRWVCRTSVLPCLCTHVLLFKAKIVAMARLIASFLCSWLIKFTTTDSCACGMQQSQCISSCKQQNYFHV